jgi:hypothetical protein
MGFRFRRSIRLLPGLRLNIGRRGVSVSAGVRGARVTVGKDGTRTTVGIPGTGMSYTDYERRRALESVDEPASNGHTGSSISMVLVVVLVVVLLAAFLS